MVVNYVSNSEGAKIYYGKRITSLGKLPPPEQETLSPNSNNFFFHCPPAETGVYGSASKLPTKQKTHQHIKKPIIPTKMYLPTVPAPVWLSFDPPKKTWGIYLKNPKISFWPPQNPTQTGPLGWVASNRWFRGQKFQRFKASILLRRCRSWKKSPDVNLLAVAWLRCSPTIVVCPWPKM